MPDKKIADKPVNYLDFIVIMRYEENGLRNIQGHKCQGFLQCVKVGTEEIISETWPLPNCEPDKDHG